MGARRKQVLSEPSLPPRRSALAPLLALPRRHRRLALILTGGMVGTALRVELIAVAPEGFPWGTLVSNLVGAAVLGYLLPRLQAASRPTTITVPFLAIGVLGAFTSFSSLALETVELASNGRLELAAGYAAASVMGGVLAALVGLRLGERR